MNDAFNTDWDSIGLPDQSPFDILSRPRAVPDTAKAPKKRGPKPSARERVIASLRDPEEGRRVRFNVDIMSRAETDRSNAIEHGSSM